MNIPFPQNGSLMDREGQKGARSGHERRFHWPRRANKVLARVMKDGFMDQNWQIGACSGNERRFHKPFFQKFLQCAVLSANFRKVLCV
jgi:hypothetical protein